MEEPWADILHGSYHKKLYCLNILSELQLSPHHAGWLQRFVETGGYFHLLELLASLDMSVLQNALSKKFISKLLKVIRFFLSETSSYCIT